MARFGPDLDCRAADPISAAHWAELHHLGEIIQAAGGLHALDEANMRIVQMDPEHSDWRAMVLESIWHYIGRVTRDRQKLSVESFYATRLFAISPERSDRS
jgi:hypothetical protein